MKDVSFNNVFQSHIPDEASTSDSLLHNNKAKNVMGPPSPSNLNDFVPRSLAEEERMLDDLFDSELEDRLFKAARASSSSAALTSSVPDPAAALRAKEALRRRTASEWGSSEDYLDDVSSGISPSYLERSATLSATNGRNPSSYAATTINAATSDSNRTRDSQHLSPLSPPSPHDRLGVSPLLYPSSSFSHTDGSQNIWSALKNPAATSVARSGVPASGFSASDTVSVTSPAAAAITDADTPAEFEPLPDEASAFIQLPFTLRRALLSINCGGKDYRDESNIRLLSITTLHSILSDLGVPISIPPLEDPADGQVVGLDMTNTTISVNHDIISHTTNNNSDVSGTSSSEARTATPVVKAVSTANGGGGYVRKMYESGKPLNFYQQKDTLSSSLQAKKMSENNRTMTELGAGGSSKFGFYEQLVKCMMKVISIRERFEERRNAARVEGESADDWKGVSNAMQGESSTSPLPSFSNPSSAASLERSDRLEGLMIALGNRKSNWVHEWIEDRIQITQSVRRIREGPTSEVDLRRTAYSDISKDDASTASGDEWDQRDWRSQMVEDRHVIRRVIEVAGRGHDVRKQLMLNKAKLDLAVRTLSSPLQLAQWLIDAHVQDVLLMTKETVTWVAEKNGSENDVMKDSKQNLITQEYEKEDEEKINRRKKIVKRQWMVIGTASSSQHAHACINGVRYKLVDMFEDFLFKARRGEEVADFDSSSLFLQKSNGKEEEESGFSLDLDSETAKNASARDCVPPIGGGRGSDWLSFESGPVYIHVLTPHARKFYNLESSWAPSLTAYTASKLNLDKDSSLETSHSQDSTGEYKDKTEIWVRRLKTKDAQL
eukprot:CAMPEP_0175043010 /NCGR_PEP_ID=MMETSP0052_2-20121109/2913_1 /TAXON_ID=51329 ORGANISM="Polytomella parva, Strain SAG 63-3" /NCGR_SAMPLE_ID=MMETSP0052_2 /ASSEMBLY_ACC=CAM_ASM_000194 /LENGTH=835 /DNA_ID=CAMNT_0016305949 /DNA_START=431 /DNA_END=2935 /DNA_ORIENTATION=-